MISMVSMLIANGDDCLDGLADAKGGEVNEGRVILGVDKSCPRENPRCAIGVVGGESRGGKQSEYEFLMYIPRKRVITARDVRLISACWHALPADTYSTLVVEMSRAVCFLENQDVKDKPSPRRCTHRSRILRSK
ncbi:hypothetical protein Tco_1211611 [Tanacetum coccineum]